MSQEQGGHLHQGAEAQWEEGVRTEEGGKLEGTWRPDEPRARRPSSPRSRSPMGGRSQDGGRREAHAAGRDMESGRGERRDERREGRVEDRRQSIGGYNDKAEPRHVSGHVGDRRQSEGYGR